MAHTPSLLVVGRDPALKGEFESALAGATRDRVALYLAPDLGAAVDAVRAREPDWVCADLGMDLRALGALAQELRSAAPGALLIAAYPHGEIAEAGNELSAFLLGAVRAGVSDFLRRPIAGPELRALLERRRDRRASASRGAARGWVAAFISNKGGVGKSTLAVNTASVLARSHPEEVLLVDAALQLGVCASLLDLAPEATIVDAARERDRLDETLLRELCTPHECGLRLLAAPRDAAEAQSVDEESLARLLTLARRSFRYVIVDSFPLLDPLLISLLDGSDRLYVVLQGTVPDTLGAARYLQVLDGLGVAAERRRVVLNRTYPPHSGRLTAADVEERLGAPVDFELPYRRGLLVAQNAGYPYALSVGGRFGYAPAHRQLVDALEAEARAEQGATAPKQTQ